MSDPYEWSLSLSRTSARVSVRPPPAPPSDGGEEDGRCWRRERVRRSGWVLDALAIERCVIKIVGEGTGWG